MGGVGVGWGVTAELLADTLLYHEASGWLGKHAQGPEGCKFHQRQQQRSEPELDSWKKKKILRLLKFLPL